MSAPRKYDQEFRDRAVRMYQERLAETGEPKRSVRRHVLVPATGPDRLRRSLLVPVVEQGGGGGSAEALGRTGDQMST
jgi:transposase